MDLGRKYSTFLSQLKGHGSWFVFTVNCLRKTCACTRAVCAVRGARGTGQLKRAKGRRLASIVRGTRAGNQGPGTTGRGPGANVRGQWITGRGARANKPRATGRGTFHAARGRRGGACLTAK